MANVRSWRNRRVPAPSAFSRFPPVHGADLEGQQRADSDAILRLIELEARA